MEIRRYAVARWEGDAVSGDGCLSTPQSGFMDGARYGHKSRFSGDPSTNPEELIAAAHAACFSMALCEQLDAGGFSAVAVDVRAELVVTVDGEPVISRINLQVRAEVPGINAATFLQLCEMAGRNCPISRLLASGTISLDAELVGPGA